METGETIEYTPRDRAAVDVVRGAWRMNETEIATLGALAILTNRPMYDVCCAFVLASHADNGFGNIEVYDRQVEERLRSATNPSRA